MRVFTRISIALLSLFLAAAMAAQTAPAPSDDAAAAPHKMMPHGFILGLAARVSHYGFS